MVAAAAAQTREGLRAGSALVGRLAALGAPRRLPAGRTTVTKTLALEAPEGVWNKDADVFAQPAYCQFFWKGCRVKCQDEQGGVSPLAISESGQTADRGHSVAAEVGEDLGLRHVAEFRCKDGPLGSVSRLMERDFHVFATELCGL